ncbi:MAG: geranylgeranylglycerol-phosphate geranylgeranyltransferase [Saprospiraceae bacterium]
MITLKKWFQFLRLANILIMVMTFYLIRILVLVPYAEFSEIDLVFSDFHFTILIIVTALTASAGNIINDIYDLKIDQINKPNKIFINQIITERNAFRLYILLNIVSMALIFWVYSQIDWFLIWMYPFGFFLTWSMLWLYSYRYKKSVLRGNIIVGIFVSFVPWSVCYPELVNALIGKNPYESTFVFTGILYILFAFVSTIFREIIKDIEDKDGDAQFGGKTLPIVYGVKKAKRIGQLFGLLLVAMVVFSVILLIQSNLIWSAIYGVIVIIIPILYIIFRLEKENQKSGFHQLSQWSKLVMLAGLIFLVVLYFEHY